MLLQNHCLQMVRNNSVVDNTVRGDSALIMVAGRVFRLRANIKLQLGESVMVRMMVND